MAIWITSDWHFCHNKDFLYTPRGFNTVEDMNKAIIERHNSIVNVDDDVYVLGDLMLSDNDTGLKCIEQLNGNIHIIRGNHDSDNRIELYKNLPNVVEIQEAKHFKYKKYHFFFCHYPTLTANYSDEKPLKSRLINICGHTHTKDKFLHFNESLIYHVEMDAHNCYPVNIEDIIKDISEKYNKRRLNEV